MLFYCFCFILFEHSCSFPVETDEIETERSIEKRWRGKYSMAFKVLVSTSESLGTIVVLTETHLTA